jgi:plasmid segregation protein ParM
MSDVLRLLAAEITKDIGTPYRDYDAIDLALRTGKAPVIFQKPYDMKRLLPLAESVAEQAVSTMKPVDRDARTACRTSSSSAAARSSSGRP